MFDSIWHDIKQQFSYGNMLTRIIWVNIGAFLLLLLAKLILPAFGGLELYERFSEWLMVSSDWRHNLTRPWVPVTYMFLHERVWHILWNLVGLYFFGRIVGDLLGDRRVLPSYLLGGLAGALAYFLMANLAPGLAFGQYMLGASAALMCLLAMAGVTAPNYLIHLPIIGGVKLKYIVLFFLVIDLVAISNHSNTGGSVAHLGGAVMGFLIAQQLQHGNDLTAPVARLCDGIGGFFAKLFAKRTPAPKVAYRSPNLKKQPAGKAGRSEGRKAPFQSSSDGRSHQEQLDAILDKIKLTGYDSLTSEEKEFLFNASNR
jgi:membrane associated rhomboid family serine protease